MGVPLIPLTKFRKIQTKSLQTSIQSTSTVCKCTVSTWTNKRWSRRIIFLTKYEYNSFSTCPYLLVLTHWSEFVQYTVCTCIYICTYLYSRVLQYSICSAAYGFPFVLYSYTSFLISTSRVREWGICLLTTRNHPDDQVYEFCIIHNRKWIKLTTFQHPIAKIK